MSEMSTTGDACVRYGEDPEAPKRTAVTVLLTDEEIAAVADDDLHTSSASSSAFAQFVAACSDIAKSQPQ